jgi:DNA recombination protein RmuC
MLYNKTYLLPATREVISSKEVLYFSAMEFLYLITGLAVGGVIAFVLLKNKSNEISALQQEKALALSKQEQLQAQLKEKEIDLARKSAELESTKKQESTLQEEINKIHVQFKDQFKVIANDILKENSKDFSESNNLLLQPLREKLRDFEETVRKKMEEDLKTSQFLKNELHSLKDLNKKISEEAHNLTVALKGDNKTQGNWGELILEKVLEKSGLVKDTEYKAQVSLNNAEGAKIQPDFIVYLPEEKHIIIDAKVSLVAYEAYVSESDETKKNALLKEHIKSLKDHIKRLSEKDYPAAMGIAAPDFVLMFVPIESSFSVAVKEDVELFNYGWDKNIVIVSPSTLLATLRTIASLWKQEKQSKNVIQIAEEAGKLYDKFVGFLDDFKALGNSMEKSQKTYNDAFNKLSTGNGNLIGKIEKLKELGLKTNKQIDKNLLE